MKKSIYSAVFTISAIVFGSVLPKGDFFGINNSYAATSESTTSVTVQALQDETFFAERADKAGLIEHVAEKYLTMADDVVAAADKLINSAKTFGLKSDDLSVHLLSKSDIEKNYNAAQYIRGTADGILDALSKRDVASSDYASFVSKYNSQWDVYVDGLEKMLSYNDYDKDAQFYENINNADSVAASVFLNKANEPYNMVSGLLSAQDADLSSTAKEAIKLALDNYRIALEKAAVDVAETKQYYNDNLNVAADIIAGVDGTEENKTDDKTPSDVAKDSNDSSPQTTTVSERQSYCSRQNSNNSGGHNDDTLEGTGVIGEAVGPQNPEACMIKTDNGLGYIDLAGIYKRLALQSHGLNFDVFVNAMKGFLIQAPETGKLAIADFTQPGTQKRFYVMDLSDLNNPALLSNTRTSHGGGGSTGFSGEKVLATAVGKQIIMSNVNGSGLSSPGFMLTAETYGGKDSWPTKLNDAGHKGRRMHGLEDKFNGKVYSPRGCVLHSSKGWTSEGYAPMSGCCLMFHPDEAKEIIMDSVGSGTLIYIHNEDADTNDHYLRDSAIINGDHGIPEDCR